MSESLVMTRCRAQWPRKAAALWAAVLAGSDQLTEPATAAVRAMAAVRATVATEAMVAAVLATVAAEATVAVLATVAAAEAMVAATVPEPGA